MPLPTTKENLYFVDRHGSVRTDATIKIKDTGYKPTDDYYPTMRAVKCVSCGLVGSLEFHNGFNLKSGDRVMNGKPIRGSCPRCAKTVELYPLPVNDPATKEVKLYYDIQKSLDTARLQGEKLTGTSIVWPLARVKAWEEHVKKQQQSGTEKV
jgi:hypothetical protein